MSTEYRLAVDFRSGEVSHVIENDRLVVSHAKDGRTESVPFASIREINLRQELPGVYSTYVYRRESPTLRIPSRHFRGLGQFDDRPGEYGAFVRALLQACARSSTQTRLTAGSSALWVLGWILVVAAAALAVLFVVGAATRGRPPLRVLVAVPLSFVVGGAFIKQGRARPVDPSQPPSALVPG